MIFDIRHTTSYTYSAPVFLEPHTVRLYPRNDRSLEVSNFSMDVEPQPAGLHNFVDAEGNSAICIWFSVETSTLSITTSFEARTFTENPFTYLVTDDDFFQLPVLYKKNDVAVLKPYRAAIEADDRVAAFGERIFTETKGATLEFLSALCSAIYADFTVEIREHGQPLPPAETFQHKKGACRDLVVLYMAVCRSFGLAARYVSGYQEGDPDTEHRQLHAWAEVYIPGGGWRGYDPTLGLVVADRHIALAASYEPGGASPIKGNFRGTGVSSKMDFSISLSTR